MVPWLKSFFVRSLTVSLFFLGLAPAVHAGGAWPFLSANQRFSLYGTAQDLVYDRVTGLLWQRAPATENNAWHAAMWHCYELWYPYASGGNIPSGASQGFRLPTAEELGTMRRFVRTIPPTGPTHSTYEVQPMSDLFQGINGGYWTSSNYPVNIHGNQNAAYVAAFGDNLGPPGAGWRWDLKNEGRNKAWCVRGGSGMVVPGSDVN